MTAKPNTTARKTTPARKAAPRKATAPSETTPATPQPAATVDPQAEPTPAAVTGADECAVPGCPRKPTTHAVCDPHWDTHRGYATKE